MLCASLAERIFLFVNRENLRIFPIYFFTGGVVAANGICSAAFCESAALRGTPSGIACGDATFPKGTAFSGNGKVSGIAQRRPLGGAGCDQREQTEGVASAVAINLPAKAQSLRARQRLHPRGSWQNRQVLTEGVLLCRGAHSKSFLYQKRLLHARCSSLFLFTDVRGRSYFWGASKAMAVAPAAASTLFREMGATS